MTAPTRQPRTITCARCSRSKPMKSRGLCPSCDTITRRDGTIIDYPTLVRAADDLLTDYRHLRGDGMPPRDIAARLGIKYPTLQRALCRARARGDRRAA